MDINNISIIFVDPKYTGNVGSLCRVMKNFGLSNLILVSENFKIDEDAYKYAMHAADILTTAKIVSSLKDALTGVGLVIGTSGKSSNSEKKFLRIAKTPREFSESISGYRGKIAILFGREDFGLLNNELELCDLLVTIPANEEYPIMNITHAAAVIFYELFLNFKNEQKGRILAEKIELDKINEFFSNILEAIDYPEHKKKNAKNMFRRFVGKANLTKWEYHMFAGIFSKILKKINRRE